MNQITSASAPIDQIDDKHQDDRMLWAQDNIQLISLLMGEHAPLLEDVIAAKNKIIDDDLFSFDYNLFSHLAHYAAYEEHKLRAESCSYNAVAVAVDGKVNASSKGADVVAKGGIPVEVKSGVFNVTALRQLKRYMKEMRSRYGIACGSEISVDLPPDVFFAQIKYSKKARAYIVLNAEDVAAFLKEVAA